jgi:hypothetical protein
MAAKNKRKTTADGSAAASLWRDRPQIYAMIPNRAVIVFETEITGRWRHRIEPVLHRGRELKDLSA